MTGPEARGSREGGLAARRRPYPQTGAALQAPQAGLFAPKASCARPTTWSTFNGSSSGTTSVEKTTPFRGLRTPHLIRAKTRVVLATIWCGQGYKRVPRRGSVYREPRDLDLGGPPCPPVAGRGLSEGTRARAPRRHAWNAVGIHRVRSPPIDARTRTDHDRPCLPTRPCARKSEEPIIRWLPPSPECALGCTPRPTRPSRRCERVCHWSPWARIGWASGRCRGTRPGRVSRRSARRQAARPDVPMQLPGPPVVLPDHDVLPLV